MNARRRMESLTILFALCLLSLKAAPMVAQDTSGSGGGGQKYTMAEYNAYTAAANEKNLQAQQKLLDDFVAKYPNSALLNYVYPLYYQNYAQQKNFPKVVEYANKELALDGKISPTERYQAYLALAYAFNNTPNPDPATAKAAYQAAQDGAKAVEALPKPDQIDPGKFDEEKKKAILNFNGTAANAAMAAKDYPNAISMYKTILTTNPDDFISNFNIGRADLAMNPPQQVDALWAFARAATSKSATDQQSKQVKAYMPKVISAYQGGTVCDALTQAELNELLQLAATTPDRPASYKLPSSADLDAARKDMTIASVVTDLKAGGDKGKLTWTAACGLEFPDVPGKIIDVTAAPDKVVLKNAFVTSDAEFEAATTPDMEVTIAAPAADASAQDKDNFELTKKLEKGNAVRFTGTLESYDPPPAFLLHWDKAKVNGDDLPKPGKKPATKRPGAKP